METIDVLLKKKPSNGSSAGKHKGVKNHERAAHHHEKAAKHHMDAAMHHSAGNHKKASESTVKALGHHCLAAEAQLEDVKYHARKK
ncbi:hypothetical protein WSM22_45860 [Cytophagales bacterium WSM2-2]|nr:hypothetical protein WSM22_45860 [Cytophagales bacterium WSM2-2]